MTSPIPYTIKRSPRAKRVTGTVRRDGTVVVTLPQRAAVRHAEELVQHHADWFLKRIAAVNALPPSPLDHLTDNDYQTHKEEARRVITERVEHFNRSLKLSYNRIAIRNQKTRWGSCSSKGNLNFNYKLLFLPPALRDYVIVHELCHLRHLNHSPAFWGMVAEVLPNYKQSKKELRAYHLSLN